MPLVDLLRAATDRTEMNSRGPQVQMASGFVDVEIVPGILPLSLDSGTWTTSVGDFLERLRAGTARYAR